MKLKPVTIAAEPSVASSRGQPLYAATSAAQATACSTSATFHSRMPERVFHPTPSSNAPTMRVRLMNIDANRVSASSFMRRVSSRAEPGVAPIVGSMETARKRRGGPAAYNPGMTSRTPG